MHTLKYILIFLGVAAIVLAFISFVIGVKVVSAVFTYVIGGIAILAIIGFIIYYVGKFTGTKNKGTTE